MAARVHHHRALASTMSSPGRTEERRLRRSPPAVDARRRRERRPRYGEVAAGTAAGCAAVCVCFPFAVVELVVLAAVRAPAALCRRSIRNRRRKRRKEMEGLILAGDASSGSVATALVEAEEEQQGWCHWPTKPAAAVETEEGQQGWCHWPTKPAAPAEELAKAEEEVWTRFSGTGFWRSPSQREETW